MSNSKLLRVALAALALPFVLEAQVIDLTINNVGLAIGDKPVMTGVRINFRDRELREVTGINATLWSPYAPAKGKVTGLALGLPTTGARDINGAAIAIFGAGVTHAFTGLAVGGLGIGGGGGGDMRGILLGGLGVGAGGTTTGISIGGLGVGGGGSISGIQIGGLGVGGGKDLTGISLAGLGGGGGGRINGLAVGGLGVGGGGSLKGIGIGGLGVGVGGDLTGVSIGGLGVGAGGTLKGVALGGLGVGAPTIRGLAIGGIGVGGLDVHAISIAGAYFNIEKQGRFDGGSIATVNDVRGAQHGLTLGLFNYARELHGAQVGLINISDNDGARRILPLLSVR
jgi:hypothetical protein